MRITLQHIVDAKQSSPAALKADIKALKEYEADRNKRTFVGNKFLYHFQTENLCQTKIGHDSLSTILLDDTKYQKLYSIMERMGRSGTLPIRLFEAWRFNGGVFFFKPAIAKHIYKYYNATSVLDPTAGWGGRMLGAHGLGIRYTGIDTNLALRPAYDQMMTELADPNLRMIWGSCLDQDFSQIDYDLVLTSPPYINKELYQGMTPFQSEERFYKDFLIPLIDKCKRHIKPGGRVCFNITPKMYLALTALGYPPASEQIPLAQQKRLGKDRGECIYTWTC